MLTQRQRSQPAWNLLTPREREVAELVIGGSTDREIARTLMISPRTVHKHLEQSYRKLGLTNRTGLVVTLVPEAARNGQLRGS